MFTNGSENVFHLNAQSYCFDSQFFDLAAEKLGRSVAVDSGKAATTVPMPGRISIKPLAIN